MVAGQPLGPAGMSVDDREIAGAEPNQAIGRSHPYAPVRRHMEIVDQADPILQKIRLCLISHKTAGAELHEPFSGNKPDTAIRSTAKITSGIVWQAVASRIGGKTS